MRPNALRGQSRRALVALLFTGVACTVDPGTGALPAPKPFVKPAATGAWSTTAQLIRDPAIQKKVDALVALTFQQGMRRDPNAEGGFSSGLVPTVDGKVTGIDGTTGPEWLAFADLENAITPQDAKALLRHENPAIRVYFAGHVARSMNDDAPTLLYPLLLDTTDVLERNGCTGAMESVAEATVERMAIDTSDHFDDAHGSALETATNDERIAAKVRGAALDYLVVDDPASAHPLAISAAHARAADFRREGVKALGLIADPSDIPLIGEQTKSTDAQDREVAARALGKFDSPAATAFLTPLLHDPEDRTQMAAAQAYARQSSASDVELAALVSGEGWGAPASAARGLADRGTLRALQLLKPSLMGEHSKLDTMSVESLFRKVGAPGLPDFRDLLTSTDVNVSDAAMQTLAQLGDKQSIPAIRKKLADTTRKYTVVDALAKLDAKEATPDILAALSDWNPNTRVAVGKALVKLRAKQTLPTLEQAADSDTTFAKPELVKSVAALKAL